MATITAILPLQGKQKSVLHLQGDDIPNNLKTGDFIKSNGELIQVLGIGMINGPVSILSDGLDILIGENNLKNNDDITFIIN